ncbi:MAG: NAD(P)H-dependent oxidoreductase [Acidobacteria bacterium]|nr:NAD(P)H-dependent oxidoreductase [Acidobacteriota bacterium]
MAHEIHFLAFSGSTRSNSFNRMLLSHAIRGASLRGASVIELHLNYFPMPLYDGDLEAAEGIPETAIRLKALFAGADGFLIASPEYNGFFSGVLKNILDWLSRPSAKEDSPVPFKGKVAAIMSASPGSLGGVRGLQHLRTLLSNLGVAVIPEQVTIPHAHKVFSSDGTLADSRFAAKAEQLGAALTAFAEKLRG